MLQASPEPPRTEALEARSSSGRITLLAVLYAVAAALPFFLVSAQEVQLRHDLGFGRAGLGAVVSVGFGASAASAAVLGRLVHRVGPSLGLRISAASSAASLLWIGVAASRWWQVALGMAMCGLANAMAQVSANLALAGGVTRGRQGIAFGAKQAAVPVASLGAGLVLPITASFAGWRAAFVAAACLVAVGIVVQPRLAPASPPRAGRRMARPTLLLLALGLAGMLAGAVANALPTFAVDSAVARGIAEGPAGVILAVGSGAAVLGRLSSGWLVDRRRSPGLAELAGLTSLGAISLLAMSLSSGSNALFVVALIAGFGTAWGWPGLIYYATVRSHPATPAAATGVVLSFVYVGNIVGPVLVGLFAQHGSYTRAWAAGTGVLVLAAATALVARHLERAQSITRPPDTSSVTPVR